MSTDYVPRKDADFDACLKNPIRLVSHKTSSRPGRGLWSMAAEAVIG